MGVIPARYASTRFPGKPLADIKGKPMIWWVYQQAIKVKDFYDVYVATDDERIQDVCIKYGIKVVMTKNDHPTHVDRIHEVSEKINADYYVVVCGDEPLISPQTIESVLPASRSDDNEMYAGGLCRYFTDPAEVIDPANIKVVTNDNDECILLSRSPVPFPYKTVMFKYKKVVGVECYNKKALDFFVSTPKGYLENIEDVTLQRFIENKIHIKYRLIHSISLSVDTPRDLEKVISFFDEKGIKD
ncbi:3-deoxy-manno-octulosonate cytidylyltransferase [Treponema socranskii]|uniref:3-deoxy-manno-octulosonate cytidylyltransferase n=1 Tax=Treponema socranskii TaxID=53419 RepID=UPI003D8F3F9E